MGGCERLCPVCRRTRLSRYNRDPVCAPCLRASRGERPAAPSWLWDSMPMREALAAGDLPAFVAIVRAAIGLSQLELASLVGWSQSTVNRIESGERDTLYDVRELLRFADAIDMPRHALMPLLLGTPLAITDAKGINGDMEMDRRHFTGVLAGSLAAGMGWGSPHIPHRIDPAHVKHLKATVDRLRVEDQRTGGGMLLAPALHLLSRVRRMIDEADYNETIGRQLLTIAGGLSADTGWFAYDSGDQRLARHLYGEARDYADQAGAHELQVQVGSLLAMQAARLGRHQQGRAREALRFVAVAKEAARHWATPRVYTLLALRETSAHASLGDESASRSSMAAAWRAFERGPREDDPPWVDFVSEAELLSFEGRTAMAVGRPTAAVDLYQRSVARWESDRNRLYGRACLAGALLASGARTDALAEGLELLPHVGGSRRTLQELAPLREAAGESSEFAQKYDRLLVA
ncbi:helix-turn-helix domain-containing protein [Sphaerisporangium fuscum]|uniref:helix-turn-helix domain-containing protein n=1 Tax=Sphaerisporangium fuscum TaxID=2835868 RepID=UPI001BDD8339|nr:helix-turn-helix transcriptional regulator [Sphaerisporangium fuscum]